MISKKKLKNTQPESVLLKKTLNSVCNYTQEAVFAATNSAHQRTCCFSRNYCNANYIGNGEESRCTTKYMLQSDSRYSIRNVELGR